MGRISRRIGWLLACILVSAIVLGAAPIAALAETVEYVDADGKPGSVDNPTVITETITSWDGSGSPSWYVAQGNVTINSRVSVTGDVCLILADDAMLSSTQGINVSSGASLTVYALSTGENMGKLSVTASNGNAGIGSDFYDSGGAITINGGNVVARGGDSDGRGSGAGIGNGSSGSVGDITINGGSVTATGPWDSAGIGGGQKGYYGAITINGGTVTATGGGNAAGIGSGTASYGSTIIITGGTVKAVGGQYADGIGDGLGDGSGAFSTGDNGNAVIFASSITDQSGKNNGSWSGIIFEGTSGQVYASGEDGTLALPHSWEVSKDYALTVPWNVALGIPAGTGLDVEGTLVNEGVIKVAGKLDWIEASFINYGEVVTLDGSSVSPVVSAFTNKLTVTGGNEGTDYDVRGATVVILGDKPLTITGTTNMERIIIDSNVQANLMLENASLDTQLGSAIGLSNDASLNLALTGENFLKPAAGKAGIHVPSGTSLTVDGTGSLSVDGGRSGSTTPGGAGIGADYGGSLGAITINGGTVVAQSTNSGSAGIGAGGWEGDTTGSSVTINGGNVTASAADGGGEGSINAATVTINGGVVDVPDDRLDGASKSNCIVFKNGIGQTYAPGGGTVSIAQNWVIPANHTLTVTEDVTLKIAGTLTWTGAEIESYGVIELAETGSVDPALVNLTVADVRVSEGATATFVATPAYIGVEGEPSVAYRWQVEGEGDTWTDVEGATGTQLALGGVTKEQDGTRYRCVATLGGCTAYSAPAELTVTEPDPEPTPTPTPPSRPTYPPAVVETEGGSVDVTPARPHEGDTVAITPAPDDGQEVRDVTVTGADGEAVEVADNGDGTYSFEQPAGKVTIEVVFGCDGGELCPAHGYVDLDPDQWYHDAVDWAVTTGAITGYGDGTFGPDDALTRAQMATILCRLAGEPEADTGSLPADCGEGEWYANGVAWALEAGVFRGYGDGPAFGPGDPLAREQAACVLMSAAAASGADTSARADLSAYPDADGVSGWAADALSWAVAEGVLSGVELPDGASELQPGRACTRAEMAALMMGLSARTTEWGGNKGKRGLGILPGPCVQFAPRVAESISVPKADTGRPEVWYGPAGRFELGFQCEENMDTPAAVYTNQAVPR